MKICILFIVVSFLSAQELVVDTSKRSLAAFSVNVAYALGGICMSPIAYLVQDWNWLYRVMAIINGLYLPVML